MKGLILNMAQEVAEELYDADGWDAVLTLADLEGAYTALGDYEDEELASIVAAASKLTGESGDWVLRELGYYGLPKLAAHLPDSLDLGDDPISFIRLVNDVIHPGLVKVHPETSPPAFDFADHPDGLLVTYRSSRNLPALAEGLLAGVSLLFDVQLNVSRVSTNDGSVQFLVTTSER